MAYSLLQLEKRDQRDREPVLETKTHSTTVLDSERYRVFYQAVLASMFVCECWLVDGEVLRV